MFRLFPFDRFTLLLMPLALLIVGGSLYYSNALVSRLALEEENRVQFYADALRFISQNFECESQFIFEKLIKVQQDKLPVINVPAIITDSSGKAIGDNLNLDKTHQASEKTAIINYELNYMKNKSGIKPIPVEYLPGKFNYIYYRESDVLYRLRYYPYISLLVIFLFLTLVFFGYYIAKRNEQNRVWVGMAKETAHQLGTPISGLLAWIELLKTQEITDPLEKEAILEMEKDTLRLQNIAERFSKIGSEPELKLTLLSQVVDNIFHYMKDRFGKSGRIVFVLENRIQPDLEISINAILFEWVVENLIKNAIDALKDGKGEISVFARSMGKEVWIDIKDNGKGMTGSDFERVFRPGYTTKKRGWGLGLSLSRRIIENYHKGRIFVKESEVGKGTTFRIILPK